MLPTLRASYAYLRFRLHTIAAHRLRHRVCCRRCSVAFPGASASAPASQVAGAAVAARAKEWLHRLQAGDIDRSQLTDKMSAALTADTIKQISGQLAPLGDPQSFTPLVQQSVGDMTAYVYRVAFKATTLNFEFVLDKDGKVAGLLFPAAQ